MKPAAEDKGTISAPGDDCQARLSAHPDFERLTAEEIRNAIAALDEEIRLARELPDSEIETWKTQERRQAEAELARRNGNAPPTNGAISARSPITIRIADVVREEVTWLWKDRIPIGKLTMIEGDPGLGKSWLCLAIAAAVSRGFGLPGDSTTHPGDSLLMTAEDGLGDTVRPRLEDMGGDLSRLVALRCFRDAHGKEQAATLADLDIIEKAVADHKPRLVIIDPIIAFVAGADTHKANEVRGLLSPLAGLAEKYGCAVVAVRHLNKSAARAFYRGQGSIDFVAACRSAFVVGENPDDPQVRILCHLKSNLAPKTPSLAFSIDKGIFGWNGESSLTAEQILAVPAAGEERNATDEAVEWLRAELAGGPLPAADVVKEAKRAGIQEKPLRSARERMGIKPRKAGFNSGWIWSLPREDALDPPEDAQDAENQKPGVFDPKGHLRGQEDGWEDV